MILLMIIGSVLPEGARQWCTWLAAGAAWLAAILLLPGVRAGQRAQVGGLIGIGLVLLAWVALRGGGLPLIEALSRNAALLAMIISIGFLKLVALPVVRDDGLDQLPVGKRAFRGTLLSVALFGSFINISAPVLVADRLAVRRPLDLFTAASITRVFSGCSAWSPFFAGMAVVLTYVAGVRLSVLVIVGLPFAVAGFAIVYWLATTRHAPQVEQFHGFPLQFKSLWVPVLLAVTVLTTAWLAPNLSVLIVIAAASLAVTAAVLLVRRGAFAAGRQLAGFVTNELPKTINELLLFLAAGVLAVALTAVVDLGVISLPLTRFDGPASCLVLAAMILMAMCGIHPVIAVSGLTPLLSVLNPHPELLALTYLFAWSLGTCASPLSGTHLVFQGRYGIPSWRAAFYNWPFVALMYVVGVVLLLAVAGLLGV